MSKASVVMNEKILIITNMYPSKKHKTFGIFVYKQVEQLQQVGFDVDVLAITNPLTSKMNLIKKYLSWLFRGLFLCLRGNQYKIIHCHYVFPSGLIGIIFKKVWNKKLVVTCHGSDLNKMAKKNKNVKKWTETILKSADHVIAVGQELYQEVIKEYHVRPNQVSLLSMGVNREIFKPIQNKDQVKKQLKVNESNNVILFVGNITAEKGVKELIEAFSLLKAQDNAYSLYLIGSQKDVDFCYSIKSMVNSKGIQDVFFYDNLSQSEVSKWMGIADVLVLPSYNEGFGLVALEAMACETPVIGSGVGGLRFLLENGSGIMINPHNPKNIANSIIKVVSDQEFRSSIILNSNKKVQEHDQKVIIEQIKSIYQN